MTTPVDDMGVTSTTDSSGGRATILSRVGQYISLRTAVTLVLATGMLTTGTINTLSTKFQDHREVKGFGDGPPTPFEHAFFQTACMFLGELACLLVFRMDVTRRMIQRWIQPQPEDKGSLQAASVQQQEETTALLINGDRGSGDSEVPEDTLVTMKDLALGDDDDDGWVEDRAEAEARKKRREYINPLIFWIPACCDLGGSTLLNIGLFYTSASVYQMLRGTLVVFNGFFSVIFLKHRLYPHHWGGIFLITTGTAIVGLTSVFNHDPDAVVVEKNPVLGNILVVAAQVLAATQFIVEEKFFSSKPKIAPLQAVGWEGYFGVSMATMALFVLYWIPGSDHGSVESAPYAIAQVVSDVPLALAVVGSVVSIAFFNFCGIMITKRISSTTRATIDSCRTFFIWLASLALGWEVFIPLQVLGFLVLVLGTFLYNEVIRIPRYHPWYLASKEQWLQAKEEKSKEKKLRKIQQRKERKQQTLTDDVESFAY